VTSGARRLSAEDRFEIVAVLQRYVQAVDSGRFELFDEAFTPDAVLDYRSAGGPRGSREEIAAWLAKSRAGVVTWQHLLSPPIFDLEGDLVRTHTDAYVPNLVRDERGAVQLLQTGARYHDELVRTPQGWRIAQRRFENTWAFGAGVGALIPDPHRGE